MWFKLSPNALLNLDHVHLIELDQNNPSAITFNFCGEVRSYQCESPEHAKERMSQIREAMRHPHPFIEFA